MPDCSWEQELVFNIPLAIMYESSYIHTHAHTHRGTYMHMHAYRNMYRNLYIYTNTHCYHNLLKSASNFLPFKIKTTNGGFDLHFFDYCTLFSYLFWIILAQSAKNLPGRQEMQVQFLGGEDPLEEEMAIHSSILTWEIPWTEEPGRLQSMESQDLDTT